MDITPEVTVVTEDGIFLHEGDHAYNYYDMKPGKIGKIQTDSDYFEGWFDFHHDEGGKTLLNGQRICSDQFAKAKGFRNA